MSTCFYGIWWNFEACCLFHIVSGHNKVVVIARDKVEWNIIGAYKLHSLFKAFYDLLLGAILVVVEFLKSRLDKTTKPCIILVHENLDPSVDKMHIIKNAEQIRAIIKNSRRVALVIQGHYHCGKESIIDNIPYITLPAMCEGERNSFKILEL